MSLTSLPEAATPLESRARTLLVRALLVAVWTLLAMAALVQVCRGLDLGSDLHTARLAAASGVLFAGGWIVSRDGRSRVFRVLLALCTAVLAALAWWLVPVEGKSLRDAARWRASSRATIAGLGCSDLDRALQVQGELKRYEPLYPSVAVEPRAAFQHWKQAAADGLKKQFHDLSPTEAASAAHTWDAAQAFFGAFPETEHELTRAATGWSQRATQFLARELAAVSWGDWIAFARNDSARATLAAAFPTSRMPLIVAERRWALRNVRELILVAKRTGGEDGRKLHEFCRDAEQQLLELHTVDAEPDRFRDARKLLFMAARDSVRVEIKPLLDAHRFTQAYGMARKYAVDWYAAAGLVSLTEQRKLEELRDACRYLALLAEKAGDPSEAAPPPRSVPE